MSADTRLEYDRAILYQLHGNELPAIKGYDAVLEIDPDHPQALLNLGKIFAETGRQDTAMQAWRQCLQSEKIDSLCAHLLSYSSIQAGFHDLGRAAALKAFELEPENAAYAYSVGAIFANGGLLYDARSYFERAVELEPDNVEILRGLGSFCISEFAFAERGIEVVKHAIEIDPDDISLRSILGQLYWVNLQFKEVAEQFQYIHDQGKAEVSIRFRLAVALQKVGKLGRSRQTFSELLEFCESLLNATEDIRYTIRQESFKARIQIAAGYKPAAIETLIRAKQHSEFPALNFDDGGYLPDHEERIDRLQGIVGGRDIVLMAHGTSLELLEPRLNDLAEHDICYFGMNRFGLTEDHLLKPMGREHEVIAVTPPQAINDMLPFIVEYLSRDTKNLLFTSEPTLNALSAPHPDRASLERDFGEKLLYYDARYQSSPSLIDPLHFVASNTLSVLLPLAVISKPRRIFLLGADGYLPSEEDAQTHFKSDTASFVYEDPGGVMDRFQFILKADTMEFNDAWEVNIEAAKILYDVPMPPLYNVSPKSTVAAGEKISVENFFEILGQDD